jgi:hypothetical protein
MTRGKRFTAFEKEEHGVWMVEAIDDTSEGEMLWAEFSGHAAQERALEYAKWMNSSGPEITSSIHSERFIPKEYVPCQGALMGSTELMSFTSQHRKFAFEPWGSSPREL